MSSPTQTNTGALPDLSVCEREPIHIPGSIEPNGALLVIREPELTIVQCSANTGEILYFQPETLLGRKVADVFEDHCVQSLLERASLEHLDWRRRYASGVCLRGSERVFDVSIHRHDGVLLAELEPEQDGPGIADCHVSLTDAVADLDRRLSLAELCQSVAAHVRRLTGFDRVMVYRFLQDDTGEVIAEDRREDLSPYLGLRYPASDIPAQARRLYLLNTLRLKADVGATPVPVVPPQNPVTGQPLDMSFCLLRSMSPVHVEYLRNMGVSASMSVSIIRNDRLWGLIACHHTSPRTVPQSTRITCEVLARVFSNNIAAAEQEDVRHRSEHVRDFGESLASRLREQPDVQATLSEAGDSLTSILDAQGFAVFIGGELALSGVTPGRDEVRALIDWLYANQNEHIFATEKLSERVPEAAGYADAATGLLSARIAFGARDFILWFRKPAVQVIEWAGNPDKPVEETEAGRRISPRLSFERWKQTVGDRSESWVRYERDFALNLRQVVAECLLVRYNEQVTRLNTELERSNIELDAFAYAASHDLQEPVRTIRSYAQLLGRRGADKLGDEGRQLLNVIETGATRMGNLIAALLTYGQVGGSARRERKAVNLEDVLRWVLLNINDLIAGSRASVTHDPLPTVMGDPEQLTQLIQNLIGNAIKYRKVDEAPRIHISVEPHGAEWRFGVHDNGEGFETQQAETIFGAFKRLHGREIPGTGIGLALCRRVVEHHGGKIWAESEGKGQGATFWFTLPRSS